MSAPEPLERAQPIEHAWLRLNDFFYCTGACQGERVTVLIRLDAQIDGLDDMRAVHDLVRVQLEERLHRRLLYRDIEYTWRRAGETDERRYPQTTRDAVSDLWNIVGQLWHGVTHALRGH